MSALPHEPIGDGSDPITPSLKSTLDLARRLASLHDADRKAAVGSPGSMGRARKVSVSLPEGLTAAVQERVGNGEFSHYVADAVARQLELDLVAELSELLDAEHGPVPEEYLAEAGAAWPDGE
jgi:Arc/MetJ-type ribon-helix-helix transcriptional regulator